MESMERALLTDQELTPGPRFTDAVMAAVRREAELPPIAFPWRALATGAAVGLALALVILLSLDSGSGAIAPELVSGLAEGLLRDPRLLWLLAVCAASVFLAWLPVELVET